MDHLKLRPAFPAHLKSLVFNAPVCTKAVCVIIVLAYFATLLFVDIEKLSLVPSAILKGQLYRVNTYPIAHNSILHLVLNLLTLFPLLSGFEQRYGSVTTFSLLTGAFEIVPAIIYCVIEYILWRPDSATAGASGWVFILLTVETVRQQHALSHLNIYGLNIPTWSVPFILLVVTSVLVPSSSIIGHLAHIAVGFAFGHGYMRYLRPSTKILVWVEGKLEFIHLRIPGFITTDESLDSQPIAIDLEGRDLTGPDMTSSQNSSNSSFLGQGYVLGNALT